MKRCVITNLDSDLKCCLTRTKELKFEQPKSPGGLLSVVVYRDFSLNKVNALSYLTQITGKDSVPSPAIFWV